MRLVVASFLLIPGCVDALALAASNGDQKPTAEGSTLIAAKYWSCAVIEGGEVKCWGAPSHSSTERELMLMLSKKDTKKVAHLSSAWTWGNLVYALFEDGSGAGAGAVAQPYQKWSKQPVTKEWKKLIPASFQSACGVTVDNKLYCWGLKAGNLTQYTGETNTNCHPVDVSDVGSAYYYGVGITATDQSLFSWDLRSDASCPFRGESGLKTPLGRFKSVSCPNHQRSPDGSRYVCCAVNADDGSVHCFGKQGDHEKLKPPVGRFLSVSAGVRAACGIKADDHTIQCWGDDKEHQITDTPSGKFLEVSCGVGHCCAVKMDRSITCWGAYKACACEGVNKIDQGDVNRVPAGLVSVARPLVAQ